MKVKNSKYQKMKTEQRRKDKHNGKNQNIREKPLSFSKKEYEEFRKKNGLPMLTTSKNAKKKSKSKKDSSNTDNKDSSNTGNKDSSNTDNKVLFEENDDYGQTQEISFDAELFNTRSGKKSKRTFSAVNDTVNSLVIKDNSIDHSESNTDVEIKKSKKKNKKKNNQEGNDKYKLISQENGEVRSNENIKENQLNVNKKSKKRKLDKKSHLLKTLISNYSEQLIDDTETLLNPVESKKRKLSVEQQESIPIVDKLQQRIMQKFYQSLPTDKNVKYDKIEANKQEKTKFNKLNKIVDEPNQTKANRQDKNKNQDKPVQNKRIIFDDESETFPRNKIVKNSSIQNKKIIFDEDPIPSINKVDTQNKKSVLSVEKPPKTNKKKEKLKKLLEKVNIVKPASDAGSKLRQRMMERLKAAQFRYLNEKLYTCTGGEAQVLFRTDPEAFTTYHEGYKLQVNKWPMNPLDVIVNKIHKMPKSHVIADMGCGEAALSSRVPHTVHSLDLVSSGPHVTACDMARTPLTSESVDIAVYCLSLMGTELNKYLKEANRVLKTGGRLMIAEVESRFEDVNVFTRDVERLGFRLKTLDQKHQVFFFIDFTKVRDAPVKVNKLPEITLKPCLYKRR